MYWGDMLFIGPWKKDEDWDDFESSNFMNVGGGFTFKYTVLFCYWLLCPVWILPKTLYKCCKKSSNEDEIDMNTIAARVLYPPTVTQRSYSVSGIHSILILVL